MTISFDSNHHEQFLDRLDSAVAAIQAELDTLESKVQGMTATWSGAAKTAYAIAHEDWASSMAQLRVILASARAGADRAGERLSAADKGVRSMWTS